MNEAFHFATLVWDWPIAVYLLLIGISSGMVMIAVLLKQRRQNDVITQDIVIRAATVIAPLAVIMGLVILIFHLARPWTFWYLMLHYNTHSIMSLGVILFQIYMAMLVLWSIAIYHTCLPGGGRLARAARYIGRFARMLDVIIAGLAMLLGVYTGFLLMALRSYPLLNNPVLPLLFLASGLASALAMSRLCSGLFTTQSARSFSGPLLHRLENPLLLVELSLLILFFVGLYYGGGQKSVAANHALQGFWGAVFWVGILGCGMLLPLVLSRWCGARIRQRRGYVVITSCMGLCCVLLLRLFILYAGQMVVA